MNVWNMYYGYEYGYMEYVLWLEILRDLHSFKNRINGLPQVVRYLLWCCS